MDTWLGPFDEGGDVVPPERHTPWNWATWVAHNWDAIQRQQLLCSTSDDQRQDISVFLLGCDQEELTWGQLEEFWKLAVRKMRSDAMYREAVYFPPEVFDSIAEGTLIMETPDDSCGNRSGEDREHCPFGGRGPSGLEDATYNGRAD